MFYQIHELGKPLQTVTEGDDRWEVISDAEDHYRQLSYEAGKLGDCEKDARLVILDDEGNEIASELILLSWFCDDSDQRYYSEISSPYLTGRF